MSTPLSLSLPETASMSVVPATTRTTTPAATPPTTEQVTYWSVLGVVSIAAAAGIFEVILHFAG